MIDVLLNIIGIICILISLIILSRTANKEKHIYEDVLSKYSDIKYYYEYLDNIFNNFTDIVNVGLNKVESLNNSVQEGLSHSGNEKAKNEYSNNKRKINTPTKEDNKSIIDKIVELKRQGMSEKEIARHLNKGVREVEIIIKMLENI